MSRKGENIYKRKDGRWEGRIRKMDGRYHSVYAKSYRDVREKVQVEKVKAEGTGRTIVSSKPVAAQFEAWLTGELRGRVKPSTYESYEQCMRKYVLPNFMQSGSYYLTELSVAQFMKGIRQNPALSDASRRKILTIFKIALKEISKDIPQYVPLLEGIKLPQAKSGKDIPVFSVKEQRIIENAARRASDRRVLGIILCLYTGIRIGELCALRWGDFDLEAGVMSISKTVSRVRSTAQDGKRTQLLVGTPKSPSSMRKIPLPAFLLEMIEEYQLDATREECNILSEGTAPFDPRAYQRIYKKLLREAGVKSKKFHALRHSFATRALELGVDIKTLSEILGHSGVSITLNIYAHSLMEQKKIAIEKFNNMYVAYLEPVPFAVSTMVTAPCTPL